MGPMIRGGKVKRTSKSLKEYSRKDLVDFCAIGTPKELTHFYRPLILGELFKKTKDSELIKTINILFKDVNYDDASSLGQVKLLLNAAAIADFGWDFYYSDVYGNKIGKCAKENGSRKYFKFVKEYFSSISK